MYQTWRDWSNLQSLNVRCANISTCTSGPETTLLFEAYHKILIVNRRLIFVQKVFSMGLFSKELIIGGACYWREFCVANWGGLDNKNNLKR